jgi:hypothetical protein
MKATPTTTPASGRCKSSPKSTLKEVVIPPASFSISTRRNSRLRPSTSPQSSCSDLSSLENQFSDYETPGTSAMMTPAESLTKREPLPRLSRRALRAFGNMDNTQNTATDVPSKRKRSDVDEDALLAQMLQDKEYQKDIPGQGIVKRRRKFAIEDSEDELVLSDTIGEPPSELGNLPAKGIRTCKKLMLPSRAARESAKKSIKAEGSRKVLDTDSDDSELSEYISDEDSDDLAESEVAEDDSSASEPTAIINVPSNTGNGRIGRRPLQHGRRQRQRQIQRILAPLHERTSQYERLTRVSRYNLVRRPHH